MNDDVKKITKALDGCRDMQFCPKDCPYKQYTMDCFDRMCEDASALLKEQDKLISALLKEQEELIEKTYSKGFTDGQNNMLEAISEGM